MTKLLSHLSTLEATVGRLARELEAMTAERDDWKAAAERLAVKAGRMTALVDKNARLRAELVYQRDNLRTLSVALWGEGAHYLSTFGVDRLVERIEAALAPPADAP